MNANTRTLATLGRSHRDDSHWRPVNWIRRAWALHRRPSTRLTTTSAQLKGSHVNDSKQRLSKLALLAARNAGHSALIVIICILVWAVTTDAGGYFWPGWVMLVAVLSFSRRSARPRSAIANSARSSKNATAARGERRPVSVRISRCDEENEARWVPKTRSERKSAV
jgi:hypothetical protein